MTAWYRAGYLSLAFMCFIIRDLCNTTQQFDFSYKFSLLSETIMFYGWHLVCGNVSLEAYDLLCGMREELLRTFLQGACV